MIPYNQIYAYYRTLDIDLMPPRMNFDSWKEVYNHTFKFYLSFRKQALLLPHQETTMLKNMMKHVKANNTKYR
jgi:hypothetical protein